MKTKTIFLKTAAVAVLVAMAAFWITNRAGAFTLIERALNFSSIGIVRGQTIRINAVNIGDQPVFLNFAIFDNEGVNHLPFSEAKLEPGQGTFVDLNADLIPGLEGRQQVRAMVKVQGGGPHVNAFLTSIEVFDNRTGKTELIVPAVQHDISIRTKL